FKCDNELRRYVSGIISAVKLSFVNEVTVKQTPLTAMLSPSLTPSSTFLACTVSSIASPLLLTPLTLPTSSTNPVNMKPSSSPARAISMLVDNADSQLFVHPRRLAIPQPPLSCMHPPSAPRHPYQIVTAMHCLLLFSCHSRVPAY